jgi:hypothetical protein
MTEMSLDVHACLADSLPGVTDAIYEERDGAVWATELARGPWDPNAQHGGASAAIVMRALERLDTAGADLQIARVTYELVRPAPIGELHVHAQIVRPGRRVQLLEATLSTADGVEVTRARALRVAQAPVDAGTTADPAPPAIDSSAPAGASPFGERRFPGGGIEIRFAHGSLFEPGAAFAWLRLRVPVIAGEAPTPLQRLVAAADFPNGISSGLPWEDWLFINPDLTVYIEREPRGEWIGLDAQMRVVAGGVGVAHAVLYDAEGRVGRSLQSLYVARR